MLRLLVIDDSQDDFELATVALRRYGFDLRTRRVENPAQLTEALAEQEWDLCLLDWVIPELTTPEVMRILERSRQPSLPCIVWSGNDDPKVSYIAREVLGAREFLPKAEHERLPEIVARIVAGGG